jgi:hypothetical protein
MASCKEATYSAVWLPGYFYFQANSPENNAGLFAL